MFLGRDNGRFRTRNKDHESARCISRCSEEIDGAGTIQVTASECLHPEQWTVVAW